MISYETGIGERLAVNIMNDHDGDIFVGSRHVGVVLGELSLFPYWRSVPLKTCQATRGHDEYNKFR